MTAPEPLPCPEWCQTHHRPQDDARYRVFFHDGEASAELGVTFSRVDEWFAHEGPRWRTDRVIWVKTPAGTLTFRREWDLKPLFALGPVVTPGLLDAVRQAAEMVGIELPPEAQQ